MQTQVFEPFREENSDGAEGGAGDTAGEPAATGDVSITDVGGSGGASPWSTPSTPSTSNPSGAMTTDVDVQGAGFIDQLLADTAFTRQDVDVALSAISVALLLVSLYAAMED
ncbi:MAG: hypothetical protein ACI8XM_000241 [Haloarculaceae archaeon]|jgi:hypothetical protein